MSSTIILLLLALVAIANAFSDTTPFVVWSSTKSNVVDALPSVVADETSPRTLLHALASDGSICENDALLIIYQHGLHASDLRALPSTSYLARALDESASSRQYPYIPFPSSNTSSTFLEETLFPFHNDVTNQCQSRPLTISLGQKGLDLSNGQKHAILLEIPMLEISPERKADMTRYEVLLSSTLTEMQTVFPNILVVYMGSSPRSAGLIRRSDDLHALDSIQKPLKNAGILHKYQLLTPGLIISLLASTLILLPILSFAIRALSSIQSPIIREPPKGFNAVEKKNQ